jgi:cob(I)alamin adenosyltransferase
MEYDAWRQPQQVPVADALACCAAISGHCGHYGCCLRDGTLDMVKLNKIYTKTGDDGTTGLGTGERRPKYDKRVEAYGTVDEVNAVLGMVRLHSADLEPLHSMILTIQNDLFDLGADLCVPETDKPLDYEPLRITEKQVQSLEKAIDKLNSHLEPLKSFVLPGGTSAATMLHMARTVARRAERLCVKLAKKEKVNRQAILYLNRLSDYLFVAARYANDRGQGDILWVPGKSRDSVTS